MDEKIQEALAWLDAGPDYAGKAAEILRGAQHDAEADNVRLRKRERQLYDALWTLNGHARTENATVEVSPEGLVIWHDGEQHTPDQAQDELAREGQERGEYGEDALEDTDNLELLRDIENSDGTEEALTPYGAKCVADELERLRELTSANQPCPHVRTSGGGTSYCTLAESGIEKAEQEIAELRARLADYERDLLDDFGKDRSQDNDWLRAGFMQRGAEIERLEDIIEQYESNTIKRDESVPERADEWHRWIDDDGSRVSWWMRDGLRISDAPDIRPDTEGPITLPIVSVLCCTEVNDE